MLSCRPSLPVQRFAESHCRCAHGNLRHCSISQRAAANRCRVTQRRLLLSTCAHGSQGPSDPPRVDLSAYADVEFFKIEAIMRPWRVSDVVHELTAAGILGMTQTKVLGAGVQGGTRERYKGTEHGLDSLVEKSKLDIVCFRDQVDTVVQIICDAARTGEIGDGKIFVAPVVDIIRIRTGETGATAERMQGGMSDQGGGVSGVSDVQQGDD